ncbi:MAG: hypothetical protein AAGD00_08900 [Planctomycetota bacterium]
MSDPLAESSVPGETKQSFIPVDLVVEQQPVTFWSRLRTFVLVSVIACTIWLFAEGESLGQETGLTRVFFVGEPGRLITETDGGWDNRATVTFKGSRRALQRAQRLLDAGISLKPGLDEGVNASGGVHSVQLLDTLRRHAALSQTGVSIESVSPSSVNILNTVLREVPVPVRPELNDLVLIGDVQVTPEEVTLVVPDATPEPEGGWEVAARPTPKQLRELPVSGDVTLTDVPLVMPNSLGSVRGASLSRARVLLRFQVASAQRTASLDAGVRVLADADATERFRITISPEQQSLPVRVSGSRDLVDRFDSGEYKLVAALSLSSEELEGGVVSKPVRFMLLDGGALRPVPDAVTIAGEPPIVSASATERSAP